MIARLRSSGALALVAALTVAGGAAAQQQSPPRPLPGAPWSSPVLPPSMRPAKPEPTKPALSPDKLRPAAQNLIDCKQAPKTAVTQAPTALSRWATIYCTRSGHILTTNEQYYSAVPGTRGNLRGVLNAAAIGGRNGEVGNDAYFTKIDYGALSKTESQQVTAGIDPAVVKLVKDKPLFRLDLTVDNGQVYRGVVVDPDHDPFWVIPVVNGKLAKSGFYVASVDYVNRTRQMQ